MNASMARKPTVTSRKMSAMVTENFRTGKELETKLGKLEQERRFRLRELNQESKHFIDLKLRSPSARSRETSPARSYTRESSPGRTYTRERSPDRGSFLPPVSPGRGSCLSANSRSLTPSVGSRSPSSSPPKSRSPSPRPGYLRKSLSIEENPSRQSSPNSSPEAHKRRLLSKRCSSPNPVNRKKSSVNTTEWTIKLLPQPEKQQKHSPFGSLRTAEHILRNKAGLLETNNSSYIPQIVISDGSSTPKVPLPKPRSTERRPSFSGGMDARDGAPPESKNTSLIVPQRSCRRNSLPAVPTPPSYLRSIAKKESSFVTEDSSEEVSLRYKNRPRSSSVCVPYFSHLKDAPRRDSLLKKYVAKPSSYKRTAQTLEKLIADLARGVHHTELLEGNYGGPGISMEEWEKLKECRYLRMPSKDEDVVGNTLDVEEIFSQTEEH